MTVCIQYSRPSSGNNESEVFGLDVAITNFLSAYFRYGTQDKFFCSPTDISSFDSFKALAHAANIDSETRCIGLDPRYPQHNLNHIKCLFRPDPLIADFGWKRQQVKGSGYSACGLVHTMSGERIARAVGDLCIAPMTSSDALICPSESIRDAVQNLWQIYSEYLNFHFGGSYRCPILTPVIPLGIDTDKISQKTSPTLRKIQREALGITDDEIVILFVGRLSFATKAHPLPLFMAAEKAAQRTKIKIRLLMFGYFKPKDMESHFRSLAQEFIHTLTVDFVSNEDPRFPQGLWASADIFTSLSDNIQESFGLTPIEAMACGIPSVITNWNGYREGVRHEVDGFLIPTITPPSTAGMAIAEAYYNEENYGVSLVGASQSTAIDIDRCAEAFVLLAEDSNKRRLFSENSRKRARDTFDWKHIIHSYEELWQQLAEQRQAAPPLPMIPRQWQAAHPSYPNPWQMFKSFPSRTLALEDRIQVVMSKEDIQIVLNHEINLFLPNLLVAKEFMIDLVEAIRNSPSPPAIKDIIATFPVAQQDRILRCLGWMLKHGACNLMSL